MDDAIKDGIGQGGIGDDVVPVIHRHLRGDEDGTTAMAVLDDFEQVAGQIIKKNGRLRAVQAPSRR